MKRLIPLLLSSVLLLAACADKKSNIKPPHELGDITPSVQVQKIWQSHVGRGADASGVRMRPAAADGRIYAASVDGELVAIDAANGRTLWRQQRQWRDTRDTGYSGGPAVQGDQLAIGTLDGNVCLLDAATGQQRWQVNVGSEVIAPPVFAGDLLLVRTDDGHITALKLADGSRAWLYDRGQVPALSLRGNGDLVVHAGVVFFGSDDGKLVAIRLDNGSSLWEQAAATGEGRTEIQQLADADGTPLVQGDTIFLGAYHGQLIAVDGPTGRPLWNHPFSTYASVAGSGTALVGVDDESNVWSFDDSTGGDLWKQDGLTWRWLSAPAVMGSHVVVGDVQGYVHWLDLADGKLAARDRPSRAAIRAQPLVLDDNTVVVEDVEGGITAYRVGTPQS